MHSRAVFHTQVNFSEIVMFEAERLLYLHTVYVTFLLNDNF